MIDFLSWFRPAPEQITDDLMRAPGYVWRVRKTGEILSWSFGCSEEECHQRMISHIVDQGRAAEVQQLDEVKLVKAHLVTHIETT